MADGNVRWERDITLQSSQFDKDSNRGRMVVFEHGGGSENLRVNTSFDDMSRTDVIDAEYFAGSEAHEIVDYNYFGPSRIQTKTFGNDAVTSVVYDGKRRISEYTTRDATMAANLLVGYTYDYDDVDNPLWQQTKHDNNYYDIYRYDDLYRLTGVMYRESSSQDYRTYGGSWTAGSGNWGTFNYDALGNRTSSTDGSAGQRSAGAHCECSSVASAALAPTQINRDSTNMNPAYDAAGNMTAFPTRPGSGVETGNDVSADAIYDAFNQALEIEAGSNERHHYRYDALGRRFVAFELGGTASTPEGHVTGEGYQNYQLGLGRRYIFDGSRVVTERTFEPGSTLAEVICELERIHVGSILFTAIDADTDGAAAETCLDMSANVDYAGGLASPPSVVSFYYYTNAFGRVAAYACKHSDEVIYEYLVHYVFGEVVYLGVLDNGTSPGTASDKKEDTITTLGDNNAEMLTAQSSHAPARRMSLIGATYVTGTWRDFSVEGVQVKNPIRGPTFSSRLWFPVNGPFHGVPLPGLPGGGPPIPGDIIRVGGVIDFDGVWKGGNSPIPPAQNPGGAAGAADEAAGDEVEECVEPRLPRLTITVRDKSSEDENIVGKADFTAYSPDDLATKLTAQIGTGCVEELRIVAHGSAEGISFTDAAGKKHYIGGDAARAGPNGTHTTAEAFAAKIKPSMCLCGCKIFLGACYTANGDLPAKLATGTGCSVMATTEEFSAHKGGRVFVFSKFTTKGEMKRAEPGDKGPDDYEEYKAN